MNFQVRPAEQTDLPQLGVIAKQIYRDTFGVHYSPQELEHYLEEAFSAQRLLAEFQEPESHLLLTIANDHIAGFLRLRKNPTATKWLGANHLEIHQMFVDHQYHGSGAADQLMNEAIANAQGYEWLWLAVWNQNIRAQRFYAKWGFQKFMDHHYLIDGETQVDWLMRKRIGTSY